MTTCLDCLRPIVPLSEAHTVEDPSSVCYGGPSEDTECPKLTVVRLRAELAEKIDALAKAERENAAWRALAEWEAEPNKHRSAVWETRRSSDESYLFDSCGDDDTVCNVLSPTVQEAAVALATKLGLIDSDSPEKP
jgi:hypothetical protein